MARRVKLVRFCCVRLRLTDLRLFSAAIVVLLSGVAQAGTVSGLVTTAGRPGARSRLDPSATPVPVVVWVDGPRASALSGERLVLSQRNVQFSPLLLVVVAGQSVEMPNEDDIAHNVYSRSASKSFNLGIYGKGETKSVTFDQVGLIDVLCSIHHRMRAEILVVPNPHYALTAIGSRYQIRDLPGGAYSLRTWSKSVPETRQEIAVPENGDVTLNLSLADAK
jgi:plastocyanin